MCRELFTIGNYTITGYGLCLALAIIAAYFSTELGVKYYKLNVDVVLPLVMSAIIPGFIGAKALYLVQESEYIRQNPTLIKDYIINGFVIYGGIIVAIPSVYLCLRLLKVDVLQYMDIAISSVAIAQAIGRIGCFLAGCCYGKVVPNDSLFAVNYPNDIYYSYFPVQIVCAILNLMNYIFLLAMKKHVKIKGVTLFSYMITYGIGRFIIEFFRGDEIRGSVGPLSVSQFISLFVTSIGIIGTVLCIVKHKNSENNNKFKKKQKY